MVFRRFIEMGRVVYLTEGKDAGKLACVINVIDMNRLLVDGPCSGVERKEINTRQVDLTKFVIPNVMLNQRSGKIAKKWTEEKINEQWAKTAWAGKIAAKAKREAMTDYDRFKLMKAKQTRNRLIANEIGKLRKTSKVKGGKVTKKAPKAKK